MELAQVLGLASFTVLIAGWVWRVQASNADHRNRMYQRMDAKFEIITSLIKNDYVRKDIHDLINDQHSQEITSIKQELHAIKVSIEAIGKNVSVLVAGAKKEQ